MRKIDTKIVLPLLMIKLSKIYHNFFSEGYIGTGILAMPRAFADSGIVYGLIGTPIIGLMCNWCIHMLVDINKHLSEKLNSEPMDYEEVNYRIQKHYTN
jgi:hypothetical protein